jgi:hypothetical protein
MSPPCFRRERERVVLRGERVENGSSSASHCQSRSVPMCRSQADDRHAYGTASTFGPGSRCGRVVVAAVVQGREAQPSSASRAGSLFVDALAEQPKRYAGRSR